jgi:septum formation protein
MIGLVLASGSPRRRELLARLGLEFTVVVPDVDERSAPGEDPAAYVERVARTKALAPTRPGQVVLAADTTVVVEGEILAKPADDAEAAAMLRRLSGRTHVVLTGVAVATNGTVTSSVTATEVRFRVLDDAEIEAYVATGEPHDKAGAYGIQGPAGAFVASIEGSLSNVVGLPLARTGAMLAEAGLEPMTWGPPRP